MALGGAADGLLAAAESLRVRDRPEFRRALLGEVPRLLVDSELGRQNLPGRAFGDIVNLLFERLSGFAPISVDVDACFFCCLRKR